MFEAKVEAEARGHFDLEGLTSLLTRPNQLTIYNPHTNTPTHVSVNAA